MNAGDDAGVSVIGTGPMVLVLQVAYSGRWRGLESARRVRCGASGLLVDLG